MIRSKFGRTVSPPAGAHAFFLVTSFGRYKFRLSPAAVCAVLQATLGGSATNFDILALGDRVFRFSVSSSLVGFHILKLRSFECSSFKVFFHLWGHGGPNWVQEWRKFCAEEEAKRFTVQSGKSTRRPNVSFADAVRSTPLTGANSVPISVHQPVPIGVHQPRTSVFHRLDFQNSQKLSHLSNSKGKEVIGQSGHAPAPALPTHLWI